MRSMPTIIRSTVISLHHFVLPEKGLQFFYAKSVGAVCGNIGRLSAEALVSHLLTCRQVAVCWSIMQASAKSLGGLLQRHQVAVGRSARRPCHKINLKVYQSDCIAGMEFAEKVHIHMMSPGPCRAYKRTIFAIPSSERPMLMAQNFTIMQFLALHCLPPQITCTCCTWAGPEELLQGVPPTY